MAGTTDACPRCHGEGRLDTDDGWTTICNICWGTGDKHNK